MSPKRAAVYLRLSQDSETSSSVERQRAECHLYAERQGWQVVAEAEDVDVSGSKIPPLRRPGFSRLADRSDVEVILFASLDRLARNVLDFRTIARDLQARGIAVASVKEDLDLSTASGVLVSTILAALAESEASAIGDRVRRSVAHRKARGIWPGGQVPYGYRSERAADGRMTLVVEPAEAEVIREAATRALAGESTRRVCQDLNARGIQSPRGGVWRIPSLIKVLTGHSVCGRLTAGSKTSEPGRPVPPVRGADGVILQPFAAILEPAERDRLEALLLVNYGRGAGSGRRRASRLLSGLLTCDACGGAMTVKSANGGRRAYSCAASKAGAPCSAPTSIDAEGVEAHVEALFLETIAEREVLERVELSSGAEGLEEVEEAVEAAARALAEEVTPEALARLQALQERRDALRAVPVVSEVSWRRTGRTFGQEYASRDLDGRRRLLADALVRIRVARGVRGHADAAARVEILWRFTEQPGGVVVEREDVEAAVARDAVAEEEARGAHDAEHLAEIGEEVSA